MYYGQYLDQLTATSNKLLIEPNNDTDGPILHSLINLAQIYNSEMPIFTEVLVAALFCALIRSQKLTHLKCNFNSPAFILLRVTFSSIFVKLLDTFSLTFVLMNSYFTNLDGFLQVPGYQPIVSIKQAQESC